MGRVDWDSKHMLSSLGTAITISFVLYVDWIKGEGLEFQMKLCARISWPALNGKAK